MENKQFVVDQTMCYCFQSKFKDRRAGFLEVEGEDI